MKKFLLNNKQITTVSAILFVFIIIIVIFSGNYLTVCIEREELAQNNRSELRGLSSKLAYTSDYLTEQARQFSLSGDIENLCNYWEEVLYTKSREQVVEKLSEYNPPEKEQNLLYNAKAYSDTLINTETLSMKLMLMEKNISPDDYTDKKTCEFIQKVYDYKLPEDYENLTDNEKIAKSSEILYNYFYAQSKTLIMTPIDEFQSAMNERLDNDVTKAEKGIRIASTVQKLCSVIAIFFIVVIFILIERLYIRPLRKYTDILENTENDIQKIRVVPNGVYELYKFGEVFNHLAFMLENELIRTENAERQMYDAKLQAEKANNAKSEFLAHMSHELRTPLNAIIGYLYLLDNTNFDDIQRDYCNSIKISAENLLGLINNVLDISRIESGFIEFESIDYDFHSLVNDIISVMKVQAINKNISLKTDISPDIPQYVNGDSLRMKQVLINLIGNAIKFTDNGEVTLTIKAIKHYGNKITAEFCVSDTGIGISPENCKKIFEPFIQSDSGVTRKYGGTGLGLPIANMIVKNLSNNEFSITAKPNSDKGTSFIFNVYLYYGEKPVEKNENKKVPEIAENTLILLVDDNTINLTVEKKIIASYGIEVITAESGYKAIELAEMNNFSLIFLDLHMPDIDGYETAKKLRRLPNCAYIPIIALTADAVSGIENKIYSAEMNDYLIKPFRPEKLHELIIKYLNISKENPYSFSTESNMIFDSVNCLANLDGDKNSLTRLIYHFLQFHGKSCEYIESHINSGNYINARRILHDIKGISGNLSCNRLCTCSAELLSELHENKADSLDKFICTWELTLKELQKYIAENPLNEKQSGDNFNIIFGQFLDMCGNFDITAVDLFQDNRKLFKKNMSKENFSRIENLVNCYDFKKICAEFKEDNYV